MAKRQPKTFLPLYVEGTLKDGGKTMLALRQAANMTQEHVAHILGRSPGMVLRWEHGQTPVACETIEEFARHLGYRAKLTFSQE